MHRTPPNNPRVEAPKRNTRAWQQPIWLGRKGKSKCETKDSHYLTTMWNRNRLVHIFKVYQVFQQKLYNNKYKYTNRKYHLIWDIVSFGWIQNIYFVQLRNLGCWAFGSPRSQLRWCIRCSKHQNFVARCSKDGVPAHVLHTWSILGRWYRPSMNFERISNPSTKPNHPSIL